LSVPAVPERVGGYACVRLVVSLVLLTMGGSAMYSAIVSLQPVALEFSASRSAASMPYFATTLGYGIGGVVMGRWSDKAGVMLPALFGGLCLGVGFLLATQAGSLWSFALVHGVLIGFMGASAFFVPLVADISHWFVARRGLAVGIVISGSYFAGAIWPPVLQHFVDRIGWRDTYFTMGLFCLLLTVIAAPVLRARYRHPETAESGSALQAARPLGYSAPQFLCLLCIAGIGCCAAMSMPQVHLIVYAVDLGFTAADGAQMLSVMLACGIVSRLTSGWISDRIGGLKTLMLGSFLQMVALAAFIPVDTLTGLYLVAAFFGLTQGGIVPSYALIVRTYFPAGDAGKRTGMVLMATLLGMAVGGWMAGMIYDLTGSYDVAFYNAIGFNILNLAIAASLARRASARILSLSRA
jgi:MFS family permease